MTIEVVLLGTGNPLPDPARAGAATLVRAGGKTLLFDAGRGVCMRLAGAGVLPVMLDAVVLTHLHSDHICDLNDVVTTQWVMSPQPKVLPIFGPVGTQEVVDGLKAMLRPDVGYRIAHHEDLTWEPQLDVTELNAGLVLDDNGVKVIAGDTVPCAGLDELCAGADIYVQTVLRDDLVNLVPMQRFRDTVDYHSTVEQTAQTAKRAGVHTLVLTHQIPTPGPGSADEWIAIVRKHYDGEVVFGEDLTKVTTPSA